MDNALKNSLKAKAHHLKPVLIMGGKGLTDSFVAEVNVALEAHELIKVKLRGVEKEDKPAIIESLCEQLKATLIQLVGHTITLYRKNNKS